jgi:SAM-dependent methyltransferase
MEQFNNAGRSHEHSLKFLELMNGYVDFMDNIRTVADFGCGSGQDMDWWARLEYVEITEDDDGNIIAETVKPRNYRCFAVDRDISKIDAVLPDNVTVIAGDFEERRLLSTEVDLLWCHDTFQYCTNPLNTLKLFNQQMNVNGMLCLSFPMQSAHVNNRFVSRGFNYGYFNHNIISLMYMLAVNGFDCRDAYFLKQANDPWIYAAVYKSPHAPMDPKKTTWYDLIDKNLINESVKNSVLKHGCVWQNELITLWLDRSYYFVED